MRKQYSFPVLLFIFLFTGKVWAVPPIPPVPAPVPPYSVLNYSLVFYENFDNLNLAPDKLSGNYIWYRGLWYEALPSPFNASLAPTGGLDLAWTPGQNPPETVISSCSQTGLHCRTFRYGYFEARMKWDVTLGAWPTFWLLPVQKIWGAKEYGELDVFEGQGNAFSAHMFYGTIHDWQIVNGIPTDALNNGATNHVVIPGVDFSQWHTYGVLWVPGSVTWYFDDKPVLSAPTYPIFDEQNYYLMLSSQEGVKWTSGDTTGVTAPSLDLYVRWVRVWQANGL